MLVFEEGAGQGVLVAGDVAQVDEVDAVGKAGGNLCQIVIRPCAERTGAERYAIGAAVHLTEHVSVVVAG
ncbi:hypothetical protein D3C87_1987370 [compost metagenome]